MTYCFLNRVNEVTRKSPDVVLTSGLLLTHEVSMSLLGGVDINDGGGAISSQASVAISSRASVVVGLEIAD